MSVLDKRTNLGRLEMHIFPEDLLAVAGLLDCVTRDNSGHGEWTRQTSPFLYGHNNNTVSGRSR